jgi:cob(I)alamin adenosyltransferase
MVYLNRIYTRTGDDGTTGLGDGSRISKTHPRIRALGAVDELNAVLGMAAAAGGAAGEMAVRLRRIQNDLFDVGADLCVPVPEDPAEDGDPEPDAERSPASGAVLRIGEDYVERLECWIDEAAAKLEPLTSFVLPGGTEAAAWLHLARTVCRRAETETLQLAEFEQVTPALTVYLNRLSDLLFVWARQANDGGRADLLWKPGGAT